MNKELANQWADALTKYQQAQHCLRSKNNTFCCLGVLCDLHRGQTNQGQWEESKIYFNYRVGEDVTTDEDQTLPLSMQAWADLDEHGQIDLHQLAKLSPEDRTEISDLLHDETSLAEANDAGATFEEIATFLRKYWKILMPGRDL